MILRLSRYALCGCLVATLGCQNPSSRLSNFGDDETLGARLSFSSDDTAGLETGQGHLPSLASEIADRRHETDDSKRSGIPSSSTSMMQRLLERGHEADAHGHAQEARMYYEQVLSEQPDQPEAHHRLAILADRAGDFPRAEKHYQEALLGKPNDADVLNDLGYSCFLQGRAADSERYLNQARQIDPRHPQVQENLALLYDRAKAEKMLRTVMGPRQTQATLAQLFQPADGEPQKTLPAAETREVNVANRPRQNSASEIAADDLDTLQRKMEEARLRSIAERQQRKHGSQALSVSNRDASLPALPPNFPPRVPSSLGYASAQEIPDGRINEAFRSIDDEAHARNSNRPDFAAMQNAPPVHVAYEPRRLPPSEAMPLANSVNVADQRATAPEWNAPPTPWPAYAPEASPASTIDQARYTESVPAYPSARPAQATRTSAAQRAAEIGMAAGPGAIFPAISESYESNSPQSGPAPSMRSMPGTDSRINGTMYSQPGGPGVPADWNYQPPQMGRNQPPLGRGPDPYDQMRAHQNAEFNDDQQSLAAQAGMMSNGPPSREDLPTSFDPNQQSWPTYTREQYDTRQMDHQAINAQSQLQGQDQYGGQPAPQYNPASQQSPQSYSRNW